MRDAHRVLAGRDPFDRVATRRGALRTELEHEVRGKVLRLRTEYAAAAADGKSLGRLLVHSAGTFFVLFRAFLRLTGGVPPAFAAISGAPGGGLAAGRIRMRRPPSRTWC